MAFGDNDLDLFFVDFGVPVVLGAATFDGILDDGSIELLGDGERGAVVGTDKVVLVKTSDVPGSADAGTDLTVDGTAYTLRAPPQKWSGAPDGKFSLLYLKVAE